MSEGRQLVQSPRMVVRLKEDGEVEEIVPPVVEVRPGGVVEPSGVVLVGEEGVHGEGRWGKERGGEGTSGGLYK